MINGVGVAVDLNGDTAGGLWAQGAVAHDGVDAAKPIKTGYKARSSLPAAVSATGDIVDAAGDMTGRGFMRHGGQGPAGNYWDVQHIPAVNTKATITQASAGAGKRNVCLGFVAIAASGTTAPAALQTQMNVIDGASGGATLLWAETVVFAAIVGDTKRMVATGIWLPGTADTAMTIEFAAAGGANTFESVSMYGTTAEE